MLKEPLPIGISGLEKIMHGCSSARDLWQSVDDLITKPIEKAELQAQLEILLRARKYSQQLVAANQQLQAEVRERQVLTATLSESESKFRSLVHDSSDAIAIVKADGTVTYASPSSESVLGFSPQELEGKNVFDFIHPDDLSSAIAPYNLLVNAIKYSPAGSNVCLELFCHERNFIFKVKDECIGIPLENQSQLFESFCHAENVKNISVTVKLYIVKKYIDISVGSQVGVGSIFTVSLPLNK